MGDLDLTTGQPKGPEIILLEELFEKALGNLTDPSDVFETCTQFQGILPPETIEAYLAKIFPFLINYMDRKSVLKCRSVSKGWMGVVDKFFEDYFLRSTILEPAKELKPFPITAHHWALYHLGMKTKYKDPDHKRFIRGMKDHPRNPFIGRAIFFGLLAHEEEEKNRQEFQAVYNFFKIFGKHIWTLELDIIGFPIDNERHHFFTFIIMSLFELAPNLKNLYIKGDPTRASISLSSEHNMKTIRSLAPPPALEKLGISFMAADWPFFCAPNTIEGFEKAILLRNFHSQLRVLHIQTLDHLLDFEWLNLEELHFTNIECGQLDKLDVIFSKLRLPKLELLSIGLGEGIARFEEWKLIGQKIVFMNVFQALDYLCKSSPNLKSLRFGTTCLWNKDPDQRLGFSFASSLLCPENIKTLEIPEKTIYYARHETPRGTNQLVTYKCILGLVNKTCEFKLCPCCLRGTSDYSFLLRFPHIENIHVYRDDDARSYRSGAAKRSEIVQVHKFMYNGRMYESNIWKKLPSLNVFSYGERTYTRSSYERHRRADIKFKSK